MKQFKIFSILAVFALLNIYCSSSAGGSGDAATPAPTYTIGGTVTGLPSGQSVTLANGADSKEMTADGAFTFATAVAANTAYAVTITATSSAAVCSITSGATGTVASANVTSVVIACEAGYALSGLITQVSGLETGTSVIVMLYDSATELVNPKDKKTITVAGALGAGVNYSFVVAGSKTYYIRAFRDNVGFVGGDGTAVGTPDGLPTIYSSSSNDNDPQAPKETVVMGTADNTAVNLVLEQVATSDVYKRFNTYTYNSSFAASKPYLGNNGRNPGTGLCGGYYLKMTTQADSIADLTKMSAPKVTPPTGSAITMLNDGACSSNIADNTSSSYDDSGPYRIDVGYDDKAVYTSVPTIGFTGGTWTGAAATAVLSGGTSGYIVAIRITNYGTGSVVPTGVTISPSGCTTCQTATISGGPDLTYTYGIANPTTANAGAYTFSYTTTVSAKEFANITVDTVSTVQKLPRAGYLVTGGDLSATGKVTSATPTLDWGDVAGAAAYKLSVYANSYSSNLGYVTASTDAITAALTLTGVSHSASIAAYEANPSAGQDYDAMSISPYNGFITDNGVSTVDISGTITNYTGETIDASHPLLLRGRGDNSGNGTILSLTAAGAYTITVVKAGSAGNGQIEVIYDKEGSYDLDSRTNRQFSMQNEKLDTTANVTPLNVELYPSVIMLTPADGATNTGNTPTFSWSPWTSASKPTDWSYIFFAQSPTSTSMPEIVYALSSGQVDGAVTNFTIGTFGTDHNDVICWANGGSAYAKATGVCTGGTGSPTNLGSSTTWTWGAGIIACAYDNNPCIMAKLGGGDNPMITGVSEFTLKTTP